MSTLHALINHEEMLDGYVAAATRVMTPLTDMVYQNPSDEMSDEVTFFYSAMVRDPAPFNRRGAVARVLDKTGRTKREAAMFLQFSQQRFSQEVLTAVLDDDKSRVLAAKAAKELDLQTEHAAHRHAVTKELAAAKMLTTGTVYVDVNGEIQESSNAAYETITFDIAAAHQGQLNNGTSAIIGASWHTAGTKIIDHIEDLRVRAAIEGVPTPTLAICNSALKTYLRANTQFKEWIAASPSLSERTLKGETLEGVAGIDWLFLDHTYVDAGGTTRKFIPDDVVVFLPHKDMSWIQALRGMTMVPTDINVGSGLNSLKETYGQFSYAKLSENPVALDSFMGDVFGWAVKEPGAIWQATVHGF